MPESLQVTLKHKQVHGWHSGRAADGKDCAYNLQGKREKHQRKLTVICGEKKKPTDFFSHSLAPGISEKKRSNQTT